MKNPYRVLGVVAAATEAEIKNAYRKLVLMHHPDQNPGDADGAAERFKEVQAAYDILSDPAKRIRVDQLLTRKRTTTRKRTAAGRASSPNTPRPAYRQNRGSEKTPPGASSQTMTAPFSFTRAAYEHTEGRSPFERFLWTLGGAYVDALVQQGRRR